MNSVLPYIVSILCAAIAGFASYAATRKQTKADMQRLEKQYELDIEKERERFEMEKEKLEIEHQHQLELLQKEMENNLGTSFVTAAFTEALKLPELRKQFNRELKEGLNETK